jgi:hypothetical protein
VRHGGVDERGREPTVTVVLALLRVELDAEREAPARHLDGFVDVVVGYGDCAQTASDPADRPVVAA